MGYPSSLQKIGQALADFLELEAEPDGINCNLYQSTSQSLNWHSDDEPIITKGDGSAIIISLSLGAQRTFEFRRKHLKGTPEFTTLNDFDVLVMEGKTQLFYEHRVPPMGAALCDDPRVNLTFRFIQKHEDDCRRHIS